MAANQYELQQYNKLFYELFAWQEKQSFYIFKLNITPLTNYSARVWMNHPGWCLKVVPRNVEGGLFFWHHGWLLLKKISPRKRYIVLHFFVILFFCLFAQNVFKISNLTSSAQHNLWVPKLFIFMNFFIWALLVPQIWLLNVFRYFST